MLSGIPEQSWKYGYPFFWVLVVLLTLGMYVVFRRWNLLSM